MDDDALTQTLDALVIGATWKARIDEVRGAPLRTDVPRDEALAEKSLTLTRLVLDGTLDVMRALAKAKREG